MKALSIRQPWAWLIVCGHKPLENRSWPTPYRGPLLIHAAKGMARVEYEERLNMPVSYIADTPIPPPFLGKGASRPLSPTAQGEKQTP